VQVTGSADPAVVAAAVTATGYAVEVQSLAKSPVRPNSCAATLAPDRIPHNNPRGVPVLSATPRTFIGATTFTVTGMTCAHCQRAVTEEISAVDGVDSVSVDLPTGTVTVTAARPVDRADIAAAVDEAGYALVP
jgi:copper chaperone CopZ